MFLTNSIITMNIIKGPGVPCGTRWESMWFVFFNQPNKLMAVHRVRERGKVMIKWEEMELT